MDQDVGCENSNEGEADFAAGFWLRYKVGKVHKAARHEKDSLFIHDFHVGQEFRLKGLPHQQIGNHDQLNHHLDHQLAPEEVPQEEGIRHKSDSPSEEDQRVTQNHLCGLLRLVLGPFQDGSVRFVETTFIQHSELFAENRHQG